MSPFPASGPRLGATFAEAELVVAGYTFMFAKGMITGGGLGDIFGQLRIFLAGFAASNGGSGGEFRPWLAEWAQRLASAPETQKLRPGLPDPYDNARPSPPSPDVNHQVSDERKDI